MDKYYEAMYNVSTTLKWPIQLRTRGSASQTSLRLRFVKKSIKQPNSK